VVTDDGEQDRQPSAAVIRVRAEQDVPGCVRALRAVHEHDGYPAVWPADPGRWVTSAGTDTAAWVAVDDGDVVLGHVAVLAGVHDAMLSALTRRRADLLLSVVRLFVDPAGRGRAAGAALMAAAVDYARSCSLQPTLEVTGNDTAARRLYDRLGWACLGSRPASWTDGDGRRPVLYLYALPEEAPRPAAERVSDSSRPTG
jgi:GNAT superfamily N-acetyltransferase